MRRIEEFEKTQKALRDRIAELGSTTGYGPRLFATVAQLTEGQGDSRMPTQEFVGSVLGVHITLGAIQKIIDRVSASMASFEDLGLLIVDEEQRFGVKQKERLKKYRALVDVLALAATPVPRTLQMSMVGVRDLSLIETPPAERLAIETCLSPFDEALIARAIRFELELGGEVFRGMGLRGMQVSVQGSGGQSSPLGPPVGG